MLERYFSYLKKGPVLPTAPPGWRGVLKSGPTAKTSDQEEIQNPLGFAWSFLCIGQLTPIWRVNSSIWGRRRGRADLLWDMRQVLSPMGSGAKMWTAQASALWGCTVPVPAELTTCSQVCM